MATKLSVAWSSICPEGQGGARNRIAAFKQMHQLTGLIALALIPSSIDLYEADADEGRGSLTQSELQRTLWRTSCFDCDRHPEQKLGSPAKRTRTTLLTLYLQLLVHRCGVSMLCDAGPPHAQGRDQL